MIRNMRSTATLAICLAFVLASLGLFPVTVRATPPSDIQLSYDMASKALKVTIFHATPMPTMHYIKIVDIKKNGVELSKYFYKYQTDKDVAAYTYTLPAVAGDTLEVRAICNIYGDKTVSLKVGPAAR